MNPDFFKAVSICSLSEGDYKSLGLTDGKNVLVKNEFGQAVFFARADEGLPPGIIFIPMGPWANVLVGPDTRLRNSTVQGRGGRGSSNRRARQGHARAVCRRREGKSMIQEDVICSFCGCLCDDLIVETEEGKVKRIKRACRLGNSKMMGHGRIRAPMIRKDGELKRLAPEAHD
jgi:anaerobic selenocysteine-containing dehydrogenase